MRLALAQRGGAIHATVAYSGGSVSVSLRRSTLLIVSPLLDVGRMPPYDFASRKLREWRVLVQWLFLLLVQFTALP